MEPKARIWARKTAAGLRERLYSSGLAHAGKKEEKNEKWLWRHATRAKLPRVE